MIEKQKTYSVELLTPSFCKIGKDKPEIRGASIRGMIREWKNLLGGNPDRIWGGKGGNASKVGIDLEYIVTSTSDIHLLPHKDGNLSKAVDKGGSFDLIINRLVGCSDSMWNEAKKDVENWLILGCLGQRSNRAAGSVWCEDLGVDSIEKLKESFSALKGELYISSSFDDPLEARKTASDTVKNTEFFGSFKPRTPSPIKMKVIQFSSTDYRILFFAKTGGKVKGGFRKLKTKPDPKRWENVTIQKS